MALKEKADISKYFYHCDCFEYFQTKTLSVSKKKCILEKTHIDDDFYSEFYMQRSYLFDSVNNSVTALSVNAH